MNNNLEKLVSVYNTLNQIETKGQNTVLMGACLSIMREVLGDMNKPEPTDESPTN